jgi:hypothetical protein
VEGNGHGKLKVLFSDSLDWGGDDRNYEIPQILTVASAV